MVALDATILLLLLSPNVAPPTDPGGKPVEFWKERIDFLVRELEKNREDKKNFSDKRGNVQATWAKVKFDRQIVAIAKVNGASVLYSDDGDVRTFGERSGLTVISTSQLPLPKNQAQIEMFGQKTPEPPIEPTENGDSKR